MLDKHAINKLHDYTKFLSVLGLVAFVFLTAVIELDVTPKPSPTRRCVCAVCTYNAFLVQAAEITRGRCGLPVVLTLYRILGPIGNDAYGTAGIARGGRASAGKRRWEGLAKEIQRE